MTIICSINEVSAASDNLRESRVGSTLVYYFGPREPHETPLRKLSLKKIISSISALFRNINNALLRIPMAKKEYSRIT